MSRTTTAIQTVLEWSPKGIRAWDSASQSTQGPDISALSGRIGTRHVVLALSRRAAFVRPLRVPNASAEDVGKAISLQISQLFPVGGAHLAFGFKQTSDDSSEGRLAIVAACAVDTLRKVQAELDASGMSSDATLPVAFGSPLLAADEGLADCAVVERTAEGIAIDIVAGGELRASRVVPDTADPDEIQGEVCRTFTVSGLPCGPIVASGGLQLAFADRSTQATPLAFLTGAGAAKIGINLELPEVHAHREKALVQSRARLAVLTAAAALFAMGFAAYARITKGQEVHKFETAWQARMRKLDSAKSAASTEASKIGQSAKVLASAFEPAQLPSEVLTLVSNSVPKDVWITGFTFDRGKLAFVRGAALRNEAVVEYLDALNGVADPGSGLARFRDVKMVFANNGKVENSAIVNFSIQLFPVGNVPILEGKAVKK